MKKIGFAEILTFLLFIACFVFGLIYPSRMQECVEVFFGGVVLTAVFIGYDFYD